MCLHAREWGHGAKPTAQPLYGHSGCGSGGKCFCRRMVGPHTSGAIMHLQKLNYPRIRRIASPSTYPTTAPVGGSTPRVPSPQLQTN